MRGAVAFCTCVRYPRNPCLCIWARISRGINQSFYKCFSKKHPKRSEHFQYHVAVPMAVNFKTKGKFSLQSYFFSKYLFSDKKLKTSFRGLGFLHLYWLADFFRDTCAVPAYGYVYVPFIVSVYILEKKVSLFARKEVWGLSVNRWKLEPWFLSSPLPAVTWFLVSHNSAQGLPVVIRDHVPRSSCGSSPQHLIFGSYYVRVGPLPLIFIGLLFVQIKLFC